MVVRSHQHRWWGLMARIRGSSKSENNFVSWSSSKKWEGESFYWATRGRRTDCWGGIATVGKFGVQSREGGDTYIRTARQPRQTLCLGYEPAFWRNLQFSLGYEPPFWRNFSRTDSSEYAVVNRSTLSILSALSLLSVLNNVPKINSARHLYANILSFWKVWRL